MNQMQILRFARNYNFLTLLFIGRTLLRTNVLTA